MPEASRDSASNPTGWTVALVAGHARVYKARSVGVASTWLQGLHLKLVGPAKANVSEPGTRQEEPGGYKGRAP